MSFFSTDVEGRIYDTPANLRGFHGNVLTAREGLVIGETGFPFIFQQIDPKPEPNTDRRFDLIVLVSGFEVRDDRLLIVGRPTVDAAVGFQWSYCQILIQLIERPVTIMIDDQDSTNTLSSVDTRVRLFT